MAYNHGKFIRQTLEGFVAQKTTFIFEVLVHDDASTDDTASIIKEYADQYPDIIKPVFQVENQYSKRIGIIYKYLLPKAQGKYLAWCEGDDYWCDAGKLQAQVDALEKNPQCSACFSKVQRMSFEGEPIDRYFPRVERREGVFSSGEYIGFCLDPAPGSTFPWQISGFMIRKDVYTDYMYDDPPDYRKYFEVGDIPLFLYAGLRGDIYYIDRVMSFYRTGNAQSWIGRTNSNPKEKAEYFLRKAKAYEEFDRYTNGKYHDGVAQAIRYSEYSACERLNDLPALKTGDWKKYYSSLTRKQKIKLNLRYYLPWLEKPIASVYSFLRKARS